MNVYWESDGHLNSSDARAFYVIIADENSSDRIDCPNDLFGNSERREWARKKVAELKKELGIE